MKKLLLIAMTMCCGIAFGQVTIDFETADVGYTASATEGSSGSSTDIFNRSNPNIGGNSTYIWAVEDLSLSNPSLTIDQIDVSGESSFTFSIDFLTPNSIDWDSTDELLISYSLDGGSAQNLMWVQHIPNDATNEPAALDLAFDGDGDVGQELPAIVDGSSVGVGSNFATFTTSAIPLSSNTTLDITLQFNALTSTDEGIYVDNISVSAGVFASTTLESVGFDETSSDETETNSSFATLIPVTLINHGGSQVDLSVNVTGGTADASDYTLNTTSLSFTSSSTQNVSIDINPDADIDSETIEITIAETTSTGITISEALHTISVTDDDIPNIFITEIMFNTPSTDDEWIEIYNGEGASVDVSGWTIEVAGILEFTFPGSTTLADDSYTTIALGSNGDGTYNNDNSFTPDFAHADISADVANTSATNVLSNATRTVSIVTDGGSTANEVTYTTSDDSRTNGSGPSYEIIDLTADNSSTASNWQASAVDGGSPGAFSGVTVWDGSTDGDWATGSNWSNGVPDNTTNAIIANAGTPPTIASGIEGECNDLTVNASASLTVSSGGSLAIFDRATNNGTYTVEKAVTGSAGYSILGAPVSGATIDDMSLADYVSAYDNAGDTWSTPSGTDAMSVGVGFFVGYDETSPTVSFSGTPNDGTVTYTVTETSGFELVANPYAAGITVAEFLTDNTIITGGAYLWDDGGANTGGDRVGDYITVTAVGAASAVDPSGQTNGFTGDDSPADDGYIASVQGFFVEVNNSGTISFSADHQTSADGSNDESDHYRSVEFQKVKLAIAGNDLYNEVLIGLGEGATMGVDRTLDAKKFVSGSPLSFYSLMDDEKYVIQALPNLDLDRMTVPLGFDTKAGTFEMSVIDFENIPENMNVTLVDHSTGTSYDLRDTQSFSFTSGEVVNDQRFELQFSPMEVLSVDESLNGLSIFGNTSELTIQSELNGTHEVAIYSLDGKIAFNKNITFNNGKASINTNLTENKVYVLKMGEQSFKFVIK